MSNPYTPLSESSVDLYNERTILDGIFLGTIAYGVHLVLCTWCILLQLQNKKTRLEWLYLAYVSLLFIMGSIGNATNIKVAEMAFVDQRNFPGGPAGFFATGGGPIGLTCNVVYIINSWFQDCLLLWRFWMFFSYTQRWYIAIIPCLMFLASFALSFVLIIMLCVPGITLWSNISIDLAIPYWAISIALSVIITTCITLRLLYLRRISHGSGADCVSVTAMLVESAALYTSNGLIFLVSYAINSPVQNLALPVLGQTQSIAPLLIILRVFRGRAWSKSSITKLETLRFTPTFSGDSQSSDRTTVHDIQV
ncbi:hypothetical protein D9756_010216 [Leucocoprinus leucothites]|uniref:Uncharacterized protein n=1 Tax=Leucocoprinus leucothites TaxID=201217 RepID=A0A8H5CU40_9AGAR|nr:hypothetical protein D9756_010216 [Leucoagaricus leucothites]